MQPYDNSDKADQKTKKHILVMGGQFSPNIPVLVRARMRADASGVGTTFILFSVTTVKVSTLNLLHTQAMLKLLKRWHRQFKEILEHPNTTL